MLGLQTQDYLPFTMELANEMEDEEFREFTFEKKVKKSCSSCQSPGSAVVESLQYVAAQ